jgi:rod shape-determining protein MreC
MGGLSRRNVPMEALLNRYRNLTVLVIVIVAQLLLLAWQVKTSQDVRLIRVWAVTTVTPVAGIVEAIRRNTLGFLEDYFILLDVREQNRKLREDNSRLKMENIYYRNELSTADRGRALVAFQLRTPSKTVAARVTGNSTVSTARAVFIDRGSTSGIEKGMAVVTPDGVVGKVIAVYPLASQVLLVTDPTFSVGVESQKSHIHGALNCKSGSQCTVDYIQNEDKVDLGEWFYTSGEDRVFPKGFPVGTVASARPGQLMKDIHLNLSGAPGGAEEVLVVLEGVHQQIPDAPTGTGLTRMLPPPPSDGTLDQQTVKMQTEADKIKQKYQQLGQQENHVYGGYLSNLPNFNAPVEGRGQGPAPGVADPAAKLATEKTDSAANADKAAVKPKPNEPAPTQPTVVQKQDVLGARSTSEPAANTVQKTVPKQSGPVLPLGAPRPKPPVKPPPPKESAPSQAAPPR